MQKNKHGRLLMPFIFILCCSLTKGWTQTVDRYLQLSPKGSIAIIKENRQQVVTTEGKKNILTHTLVFNNTTHAFPQGELIEGNSGNVVITSLSKTKNESNEYYINSYKVEGNTLVKTATTRLQNSFTHASITEGKAVITNDEEEGLGYEIKIYNPMLELLNSYNPFGTDGFDYSLQSFTQNRAAYIFFPTKRSTLAKLAIFDTRTGSLLSEQNLNSLMYNISGVTIVGNHVLIMQNEISGKQELVCYTAKGEILWQKLKSVFNIQPFRQNNKWYAFIIDESQYSFIDVSSGVETGNISLLGLAGESWLGRELWAETISGFESKTINVMFSNKVGGMYKNKVYTIRGINAKANLIKSFETTDMIFFKKLISLNVFTNSDNKIIYSYEN